MEWSLLARSALIGFSIAAPVGPIGLLCLRRTLAHGRLAGLVSGLGAATADACYGAVAALGLTVISSFLVSQQGWLRLVGGGFLCYLGWQTLRSDPAHRSAEARGRGLAGAYLSTLALTLTNPMTILSFAAIFAGIGAGLAGDAAAALTVVLGVFLGSALWWCLLSGAAGALRRWLDAGHLRWVNRLSGAVIGAFGLAALLAAFA